MPRILGQVIELGIGVEWRRGFFGDVIAVQNKKALAHAKIDRLGQFVIDLPAGVTGEVEIRTSLNAAAPTLLVLEGDEDVEIHIIVNRASTHAY